MAVAGPWAGYGCYVLLRRAPLGVAVFVAVAVADLATYVVTAFQLALAFPDPSSGLLGALARFLGIFAVTQVPLAVVEGILGVLLVRALRSWAGPELAGLGRVGSFDDEPTGSATKGADVDA